MSSTKVSAIPVALFDVSSSSVGGAHALVKKGSRGNAVSSEKAAVLVQSRVDAPLQAEPSIERVVAETLKAIEAVATAIRKQDVHQPEYIQIVLASPWYSSQTRTVTFSKGAPFVCTEKLVHGLVDKEIQHIIENEKDRFGDLGHEYMIVEKQLSLIKLNGYVTHTPYGKRAQSIELFLTVTVAPKKVVDQFTDLLRRMYGTRKIGITTSAYTTFVSMRSQATSAHEAVIVDIGEEVTDVAFVKDELFLYQHSFPVGTFELYRVLATVGGHTTSEAFAILEAYRMQKLSAAAKAAVDTSLATFATTWQKGLQSIVDEGHYGFALPPVWYVTVDPHFMQLMNTTITGDPYLAHRANAPLVPTVLAPETFEGIVKPAPDTVLDVPLASGLLFIERLM